MKQLNDIMHLLTTDQFYAINVTENQTGNCLGKNLTGAALEAKYGSVEEFFNKLFTDGVQSIIIQPRRKNGSSWVPDPRRAPQVINMRAQDEPQQIAQQPTLPQPAVHIPEIIPGLQGGLNAQMIYNYMDYNRVITDNAELRAKCEKLKDEVDTLKFEAQKTEFSEAKAKGNKEMLNGLAETLMPLAQMLLANRTGVAIPQPAGLGQPQTGLSASKQAVVDAITASEDYVSDYLLKVFDGFSTNEAFTTELLNLLKKFNL